MVIWSGGTSRFSMSGVIAGGGGTGCKGGAGGMGCEGGAGVGGSVWRFTYVVLFSKLSVAFIMAPVPC